MLSRRWYDEWEKEIEGIFCRKTFIDWEKKANEDGWRIAKRMLNDFRRKCEKGFFHGREEMLLLGFPFYLQEIRGMLFTLKLFQEQRFDHSYCFYLQKRLFELEALLVKKRGELENETGQTRIQLS